MKFKRVILIMISLGGNALRIGKDSLKPQNKFLACLKTTKFVIDLVKEGHNISISTWLIKFSIN